MSYRKIVSLISALMIGAFSAPAYAADVNTTTTYNTQSGKVEVSTTVSGAEIDSEVTYIVKSSGQVVYIDQDTAIDGEVNFTYKINKAKIADDYSTSVKFGSSASEETFSGNGTDSLGIVKLPQAEAGAGYTIVYPNGPGAWGYGEKVTVTVIPDDGYELSAIYVNGELIDSVTGTFEVTYGDTVSAEVTEAVVEAGLQYIVLGLETETGSNEGLKSKIAILKPQGDVSEIGVVYNNDFYKSSVNEMSAVKIIFPEAEKDENCILVGAYKTSESDEVKYGTDKTAEGFEQ